MNDHNNHKISNLVKLVGIITIFAALSGCHALPMHHGHSYGHGYYGEYNSGNHHSRSRSHSRDY